MTGKLLTRLAVGAALLLAAGCGGAPSGSGPAPSAGASQQAPRQQAPFPPAPAPPAAPEAAPAETRTDVVRQKAEVGVGKKGRGYGSGPVATPAAVYFSTREKLAFNIQIPHAMNLYKGEHGQAPKTHEEFMEQIIKPNMIQLPELPEGHRYVYDPQREELMVERSR